MDIIEILWIAIPTCFKIYSSRPEGTIALVSTIIGRVIELKIKSDEITMLKVKLHLLIMAVAVTQKQEAETLFNTLFAEIEQIDKVKLDLANENLVNGINVEVNLTKAYFFYKLRRGKYTHVERVHLKEDQKRLFRVGRILKHNCESVLPKLGPDFEIEQAAATLLASKAKLNSKKKKLYDHFETQLKNALGVYAAKNCKKLELKVRFIIAEIKLL